MFRTNMDMIGTESICQKILSSPFYFNNFSIVLAVLVAELHLCPADSYLLHADLRLCLADSYLLHTESCLCPAESYLLCTELKVFIQQIQKELLGNFSQF